MVTLVVILPLLSTLSLSSVAYAGVPSNQIEMEVLPLCTKLEKTTLLTYNTRITVSGTNQNGNYETWSTTDHPDGVFETTGWWWYGQVVVTLYPTGLAPIKIYGFVPEAKSSSVVRIINRTLVIMSCMGTQSLPVSVAVPYLGGPGGSWLVWCISPSNWTGTYYVQRTYLGYFYYDGVFNTGASPYTPGSYQVVTNTMRTRYSVPLHPTSVTDQRECSQQLSQPPPFSENP